MFDGSITWNVVPDPVPERTSMNYSQVILSLTNGTTQTRWLSSTAPWTITDGTGAQVYVPVASQGYTPLMPGQTKSWPWALVRQDSSFVPPGEYVANIKLHPAPGDTSGVWLRERLAVVPRPGGAVIWEVTPLVQSTKSIVQLTLTNATQDNICCSSLIPWTIKDRRGNVVYTPLRLWAILDLPPGESRSWVWDERNDHGEWVSALPYRAEVTYWRCDEGSGTGTTLVSNFRLVDPPGFPCEFLVPDHYLHVIGDPVPFTFTNCVPDTIVMPWYHGWWVTNAAGLPVYSPIVLMVITSMSAYEQFTASWDQKDYRGYQVPVGGYYLWSGFWDKYHAAFYVVRSRLPVMVLPSILAVPSETPGESPLLRVIINPAFGEVELELSAPEGAEAAHLSILSISGRILFEHGFEPIANGSRRFTWDGKDATGGRVPSGIYFAHVRAGSRCATQKLVFLR